MHSVQVIFQKILQLLLLRKIGLNKVAIFFSVHFNPIDANDILDIHFYLIKRTCNKKMFELIKKIFIALLTDLVHDLIIQSAFR